MTKRHCRSSMLHARSLTCARGREQGGGFTRFRASTTRVHVPRAVVRKTSTRTLGRGTAGRARVRTRSIPDEVNALIGVQTEENVSMRDEKENRGTVNAIDPAVMRRTPDDSAAAESDAEAVKEMTRVLQTSLSPRAARLIAKGFVDLGIKEPGDLRAVVAKRSLGMIGIELVAAIFNVALCMSLFSLAVIVHYSGYEILLPTFLNYVAGFCVLVGAAIFAVEAAAHLIILGVYVYSTVRFETSNLKKFVSVVRRIGDEDHVVGGFTQPLSSLKRATTLVHVVNILTQLRDALHSEAELIDLKHKGTLHNLAAYFEYSNAQSKYGFKPEDYGIEPKEAMSLAALFSEWDTDGSGTLSSTELKYLLNALGHDTVNEMEVNMAMRVLDKDETGEVNFSEFVRWYREGVILPMASKLESNANESDDLQNADPSSSIDEPSS